MLAEGLSSLILLWSTLAVLITLGWGVVLARRQVRRRMDLAPELASARWEGRPAALGVASLTAFVHVMTMLFYPGPVWTLLLGLTISYLTYAACCRGQVLLLVKDDSGRRRELAERFHERLWGPIGDFTLSEQFMIIGVVLLGAAAGVLLRVGLIAGESPYIFH